MAFVLYDVLPTEIVWEIEKQKQKLCMKDVVDEFNTISNFIKRNSHAGENTYYEIYFSYTKIKTPYMGREHLTDEEMVKDYPELFTDGFSEEKKQIIYEDIYNDYDSYEFQDREYDETIYTDYNEFRMGDWDVEESWRTLAIMDYYQIVVLDFYQIVVMKKKIVMKMTGTMDYYQIVVLDFYQIVVMKKKIVMKMWDN
jgi:hypothetical protein